MTMASDVNIIPTSSITSPRWLWGGPSPRRADGTPIINSLQKDIKYDTTRLISLIFLRYIMGCTTPHIDAVLSVSPSLIILLSNRLPSCQAGKHSVEHPQPIRDRQSQSRSDYYMTGRPLNLKMKLIIQNLLHLPNTETKKSFDLIRMHWIIISPLEIFDRVGFLGYGYYFRFWLSPAQLAYKKRVNQTNTESYRLFRIDEVYIFSHGVDIVM